MERSKNKVKNNNNDGLRWKRNDMVAVFMTAMLTTTLQEYPTTMATEFTVGDATGWDFAPTTSYYSDWASGVKFLPGDKLVFKYLPSAHNVQEVTEGDYAACNSVNPIAEYESGNDIITLPKPGTHYYICGFLGHCDQGGMKLKATVVSTTTPTPSPTQIPQLLSPMTSFIPQLPGDHGPHGHSHGTPPPTAAPIAIPGGHSWGAPSLVPMCLAQLLFLSLGIAFASISL